MDKIGKWYIAKSENPSYVYVYSRKQRIWVTFTINTLNKRVYTRDLWTKGLISQSHIVQCDPQERLAIKKTFEYVIITE